MGKLKRKLWLKRNWWWISIAYGTSIVLLMWPPIAAAPEFSSAEKQAMLLAVAVSAASLTGVMLKCEPPYGKAMTFRQARFNPGNDR